MANPLTEAEITVRLGDLLKNYVRDIHQSLRLLGQMFEELKSSSNKGKIERIYDQISENIETLDMDKANIIEELAKVSLIMLNKDNWMRIVNNLESISDYAEGVAANIVFLVSKNERPEKLSEIYTMMLEMYDLVLNAYESLKDIIYTLASKPSLILEKYKILEKWEREVDRKYRFIGFKIVNSDISLPIMLLLKDIVERVENMTDAMKRAVDECKALVIQMGR